jgi:hypothetical protein
MEPNSLTGVEEGQTFNLIWNLSSVIWNASSGQHYSCSSKKEIWNVFGVDAQGSIYWKIPPPPLGKKYEKAKRKRGNVKDKERLGKEKEKRGIKRVK